MKSFQVEFLMIRVVIQSYALNQEMLRCTDTDSSESTLVSPIWIGFTSKQLGTSLVPKGM